MKDTYCINGKKFRLVVDKEELDETIKGLAERINTDYKGKTPVFLVVLKGAIFFAVDLLRYIELDCEMETISAKSYGMNMKSSGTVAISPGNLVLKGKDVIIVEDIVDNGYTIKKLGEIIMQMEPASLEIAVLLSKPDQRKVELDIKYLGMELPSDFIIGCGLDYAERGRNLPGLYSWNPEASC